MANGIYFTGSPFVLCEIPEELGPAPYEDVGIILGVGNADRFSEAPNNFMIVRFDDGNRGRRGLYVYTTTDPISHYPSYGSKAIFPARIEHVWGEVAARDLHPVL